MDVNLIRAILSVAAMAAFLAVVWWAYAPSRKSRWEQKGILEKDDA